MPNDRDQISVTVVRADSAPTATEEDVYRAFADALPGTALMVCDGPGQQCHQGEASRGECPYDVLSGAENFLLGLATERMVTVAMASVCPATGAVTLASAGHPPPLLRDGSAVRAMEVDTGPPLGAGPAPRPESHSSLPPGGVMLFYTDGLLGPLLAVDEAMEELGACLSRLPPGAPLDKLVTGVIRRTADIQPSDDVAVVAMRRLDAGQS